MPRIQSIAAAAVLSCLGFAALAGACASGTTEEQGTGGTGNTTTTITGSGGAGGGGHVGLPCTQNADCDSGICLQIGQGEGVGKYCVTKCPPECGAGSYCALINGQGYCIPDRGNECTQCIGKINCLDVADACLTAPLGDKFCARDCTLEGKCPTGFSCVDENLYQSGGWPPAGGAGGTSGGTGGNGPTPTVPERFCVPNNGDSCPCDTKRDGVHQQCENTTPEGTCIGDATCNGGTKQWEGCTAGTPSPESCNGLDDNCNSQVDEGTDAELCAGAGAPPSHSVWECNAGACVRGVCSPGRAAYPVPASPQAGCDCSADNAEPNNTCAQVTNAGTVTDNTANVITMSGTLSADNDVDVYGFTTTDANEVTTNSYHVTIAFTANPNNEFQFDVVRGACSNSPPAASTNLTSYDWCVNGLSGIVGEAPCSDTGTNHCGAHSSPYYVRVHRKVGVTGTCAQYTFTIKAGGGVCTFGGQCP